MVKVAIAPWVDGSGDYHAGSEVYSVMRKGGWYVAPRDTVRRVELLAVPPGPPGPVTASVSAAPLAVAKPPASPVRQVGATTPTKTLAATPAKGAAIAPTPQTPSLGAPAPVVLAKAAPNDPTPH